MDISIIKNFLDACHEAKRVTELMPKLPKGMSPRHIHVLDAIWQLERAGKDVKVSDVSEFLNVTRPSITKLINELEREQAVEKEQDQSDRRVIHLRLTKLGEKYYKFYVEKYQTWLAERIQESGISPQELRVTADTIARVYRLMNTGAVSETQ